MTIELVRTAVLTSVAATPQHGYGILRDVETLSGGRVTPPIGSLYRVIDHLLRDGLIEEDSSDIVDGRFRRYYRLTAEGRHELEQSVATMAAVATQAKRRLRGPVKPAVVRGAEA